MKRILMFASMALLSAGAFAQTSGALAQTKIAHVNFTEIVQLTPDADAARTTMKASQKEAEDTFQSMYEEYQTKMNQYQQKNATWTPAIKEAKEKELGDIQQRLQEFQQQISQELQQQQAQLFAPIYDKAQETVKKIARDMGLTAVFDSSSALYFDEATTVDITPDARKAMNIPYDRTLEQLQQELAAEQQAQ